MALTLAHKAGEINPAKGYDRAAAMRKRWADPAWKAQTAAAISEGVSEYWRRGRVQPVTRIFLSKATQERLWQAAERRCISPHELVRQYIQRSLETDELANSLPQISGREDAVARGAAGKRTCDVAGA